MATKIRLTRHGRKKRAFYHIVVADSRAPRDGKFIESIGSYNPNTDPATINLDLQKAVSWIEKGAQPTDTAKAIMSYKGALLKVHLNKGVKKGALTQEQAEEKFNIWLESKGEKVTIKIDSLGKAKADKLAASLTAETEKKQSIQAKIDAKLNPVSEQEVVVDEATEAENEVETAVEETTPVDQTPVLEEALVATEEAAPIEETPISEAALVVEEEAAPIEETPILEAAPVIAEEAAPIEETPKEEA